jgi:hypothetical protein
MFWLCCIKNHLFNVIIDSGFVETAAVLPFLNESTEAWAVLMATSFLQQSRLYPKRYFDSIADSILVNQL